jgi:hypothetical protein
MESLDFLAPREDCTRLLCSQIKPEPLYIERTNKGEKRCASVGLGDGRGRSVVAQAMTAATAKAARLTLTSSCPEARTQSAPFIARLYRRLSPQPQPLLFSKPWASQSPRTPWPLCALCLFPPRVSSFLLAAFPISLVGIRSWRHCRHHHPASRRGLAATGNS